MTLRPVTVLVSASGAPGTAALLRALRVNGERKLRLVGTDMSERSVGRHLCDAFHLVPAGSDPGFADAIDERGRLPGPGRFGSCTAGLAGAKEKSVSSLLSRKPRPGTVMPLPPVDSMVSV